MQSDNKDLMINTLVVTALIVYTGSIIYVVSYVGDISVSLCDGLIDDNLVDDKMPGVRCPNCLKRGVTQ